MPEKRIIACFHPQAWINDYAVDADPEGETEFDVTAEVLAMGKAKALALEDDDYDTDDLRYAETAPKWMQEWHGPFYVEVAKSIADYFDEDPK